MDPAILRKWTVLSELSDEKLEKVAFLNLFADGNPGHADGAFLITDDGEVDTVGRRHWFCRFIEAAEGGKTNLGLTARKIEVGDSIAVALTKSDDLFWVFKSPESAHVYFEVYDASKVVCGVCAGSNLLRVVGGLALNYCGSRCKKYLTREHHTPGTTAVMVDFTKTVIRCTKCFKKCSSLAVGDTKVNFCTPCLYFPQDAVFIDPGQELNELSGSVKFVDVACGSSFFVALTNQNDLILNGWLYYKKYDGTIYNPGSVEVKEFTCGSSHVAVVTAQGDLYTCGEGSRGQLGYNWTPEMGLNTLRQVQLDGKVAKVCCGDRSTACLMTDGSIMCFGSGMKMLSPGVLALNQSEMDYITEPARVMENKKFTDLASARLYDRFAAKTDTMVFMWGKEDSTQPKLVWNESNLMAALANHSVSFRKPRPNQLTTLIPLLNSTLHGKTFLSDLTIKLQDEDFPAHRFILFTNSVYFRNVFQEDDSISVLDMSHYNPEAYRCLLEHFYGVPPTDLEVPSLFDLYVLAVSYKETDIALKAFEKLKSKITTETVLGLLRKVKETNCSKVLEECNIVIGSAGFHQEIARKYTEDLEKTITVLEALENNQTES